MARAAPRGWCVDIAYTLIHTSIMAGIFYTEGAHAGGLERETSAPAYKSRTFDTWASRMTAGEQNDDHDEYPNTLSTTAHIYSLSFQPGSGASGYDLPDAPPAAAVPTSTLPPPLRGALPMRTSSLPMTTSLVGLTASTYQDSLTIPVS